MLGKRDKQVGLFDVGNVYPLAISPSSFYGQLAAAASRLFADEDFSVFYSDKLGRPSVPPTQLALTILLQNYEGVSDHEAVDNTAYDLRWAAVLGKHAGAPLCAKSTLQLFRAHLILHEEIRNVFIASIKEAKRVGLLKGKALSIATDTKPIYGRGAVQDTYNLIATGIRQLSTRLARTKRQKPRDWMKCKGLARYTESSVKGSADIDWSDAAQRQTLLSQIVSDARRLLAMCAGGEIPSDVLSAAELLERLLLQDVQEVASASGKTEAKIKEGTERDRIPSATDPEQRHGHKSHSRHFTGHKASVAVETDSQVIAAVEVLPGNAPDATGLMELVEQAEAATELPVVETIGDCAYGSGKTRQDFTDAGRTLIAKAPKEPDRGIQFSKSKFQIDLANGAVSCPAGCTTSRFHQFPDGRREFYFGKACRKCEIRPMCTSAMHGRTILVHPQEALLAKARAYQATPEGRTHLRKRVAVEHRLARLSQLGIGQARYVGRAKTLFQLTIAATIANLRLAWNFEQAQHATSEAIRASCALISAAFCRAIVSLTRTPAFVIEKPFVLHPGVEPRIRHEYA